jgi:uncharacterized protein (TIGR03437 family)
MFLRNAQWQESCIYERQSVPPVRTASSWRSLLKKLKSIFSLIPILFSAAALDAQTISIDKSSLSFSAQSGGSAVTQQLTVTAASATQIFVYSTVSWLRVNGVDNVGGSTPLTVTVSALPTGLPAGNYTTNLGVLVANGPTTLVPVTFSVGSVGVTPASLSFSYQLNGTTPAAANLTLTSSGSVNYTAAATTASGGAWLAVPSSGTSPGTLAVAVNGAVLAGLTPGTYSGTVTITPASGPAITVAVGLTVAAAPTVTSSASAVALNYQVGGAAGATNTPTATVTLTNPGVQAVTFGIATNPNGTWLSATPGSGTIPAGGTADITISYLIAQGLAPNTYTGQVTVFLPNAANQTINIPVTLRISASPLLNVPNGTQAFTFQVGGAAPAAKNVVATSSAVAIDAASGQMTLLLTKSDNSNWLSVPSTGVTGSATPISIGVNPAGLAVGTYTATISIIGNGAANNPQTIPVSLTVSNDPLIITTFGGCSSVNTTCPLNFPIQIGQNQTTVQNVRAESSTGAQVSFSAVANMTTSAACGTSWLSTGVTAAVIGNSATFPITVSPGAIVAGTTCEGSIVISGINATGAALPNTVTIPVKMYVSADAMLVANPIALNFSIAPNATSSQQQITVTSTSTTNLNFNATTTAPWLLAFPLATNTAAGANVITLVAVSTNLAPGTYTTNLTLTATTAGVQNSPLNIPITMTVTAATMSVTPTTLSFSQALGANPPAAQTLRVSTSNQDINFTTSVSTQQGSGWLSATPSGTATSANPATVSVNVNGSNLPAGTYNGTVTITSPTAAGSPVNVAVTLVVQAGTLTASPTSLSFDQVQGGGAPAAKTIALGGTPGSLAYTVAVSTNGNSGNWLAATPASGTTNSAVQVSVNSGTLLPGQYTGKVTITSTGASGSPIEVPVTLNVFGPQTFTVSPTTLSFEYVIGTTAPAAKTVQLTASSPTAPFSAAATTSGGGTWLTVSPASGAGSGTLTIGINTAILATAGSYTGAVTITSPNAVANPAATITVALTVTAIPKPVISAVANAASYVQGAVSPGENIVIFGSGIGPATLTTPTGTITSFPTTLGNTQVFFDSIAAPVIYASAGQTSVMVPYGVAGRQTTNIRVVYSGVQGDAIPYNVIAAGPGIYTANSSGTGQGAILNQDFSVNSGSKPAAKNSVVTVYLSGEGATNAPPSAALDGRIAPIDGTGLYKPNLAVTATIGGQPATVEYYGTAPGIVYGVMQVNLRISANAPSGNQPVVISVGPANSQANVTVAIAQ